MYEYIDQQQQQRIQDRAWFAEQFDLLQRYHPPPPPPPPGDDVRLLRSSSRIFEDLGGVHVSEKKRFSAGFRWKQKELRFSAGFRWKRKESSDASNAAMLDVLLSQRLQIENLVPQYPIYGAMLAKTFFGAIETPNIPTPNRREAHFDLEVQECAFLALLALEDFVDCGIRGGKKSRRYLRRGKSSPRVGKVEAGWGSDKGRLGETLSPSNEMGISFGKEEALETIMKTLANVRRVFLAVRASTARGCLTKLAILKIPRGFQTAKGRSIILIQMGMELNSSRLGLNSSVHFCIMKGLPKKNHGPHDHATSKSSNKENLKRKKSIVKEKKIYQTFRRPGYLDDGQKAQTQKLQKQDTTTSSPFASLPISTESFVIVFLPREGEGVPLRICSFQNLKAGIMGFDSE
ncbi:hypothetical protein M5K25_006624 [Dendrobium thyrsiflorum]|uniref:Uncharacterized protein n=1 Tax=Dendrobium thyrsiflorum TaxID=117978 RepID=A0ABD0VBK7_DENTH